MRGFIILLIVILFNQTVAQDKPGWIDPNVRRVTFPEDSYLVGFSSQYYSDLDDLNEIKDKVNGLARAALSENIQIQITSVSNSKIQNTNGNADEHYSKSVVTGSTLDAVGLKSEVYVDVRKRVVYGLAYVTHKKLAANYFHRLTSNMTQIDDMIKQAALIQDKGRAYSTYLDVLEKLENLKQTQNTLRILGASNDVVLKTTEWRKYYQIAYDEAEKLRGSEQITLMEAAHFLTDKLILELEDKSAMIVMGLITYKNTGAGSELSERLRLLMIDIFREKSISVSQSPYRGGVQYFLSGSYWPGTDKVQISASIEEHHDREVVRLLAGGSVFITNSSLNDEGVDFEPGDLTKAVQIRKEIENDPIGDNGMSAELWTNKAGNQILYREGDILKLTVRVNQPAYLRLLNVWNDGTKVLLLDNYYLPPAQTNKVIELPFEWQTSCPCGVEYLQLLAQNEEFVRLETHSEGEFVIIDESLRSILEKSRGFGSRKKEGDFFSEKTITVTTLRK